MDSSVNHGLQRPGITTDMNKRCPEERIVFLEAVGSSHPDPCLRELAGQAARALRHAERLILYLDGQLDAFASRNNHSSDGRPRPPAAQRRPIAELSHEIKNGLNAILNIGWLLSGEIVSDTGKSYLATVTKVGEEMLQTTDYYLALCSGQANISAEMPERFCLRQLIMDTLETFHCAAARKDIQLRFEGGESGPTGVFTERFAVASALRNLIGNAIKFSAEGEVVVRLRGPNSPTICLEVADQGAGIPPEVREKLFLPFHSWKNGQTGNAGTGFGLAMAHHLITRIGGTISVHHNNPQGALFRLDFPAVMTP